MKRDAIWTIWAHLFAMQNTAGSILRGSSGLAASDYGLERAEPSSLTAYSSSFAADSSEDKCSFELYDPKADVMRMVQLEADSNAFHQGDVFVVDGPVQDGYYQRYLTFRQDSGSHGSSAFSSFFGSGAVQNLMLPKCREQVQVTCQLSSQGTEGLVSCNRQCHPDVRENMVPEYRALLGSALTSRAQLHRASILGFGAGIIPTALAQSHPEAVVESVDISADVLAAASCFGVEPSENMKLQQADGRSYLEGLEDGTLDMLIMDIYDDKAHIPPCFTTSEFYALAKRKLSNDGTFAMNIVTDQLQDVLPSVVASFPNVQLGTLTNNQGNNVLLARVTSHARSDGSTEGASNMSFAQTVDSGFASILETWSREVKFLTISHTGMKAPRADSDWCA